MNMVSRSFYLNLASLIKVESVNVNKKYNRSFFSVLVSGMRFTSKGSRVGCVVMMPVR